MDKQDERVRFLAKLPPDLHRWLKITAAEQGADMNALLVMALENVRGRDAITQAITESLRREAVAEWEREPADGVAIEIYVSQIAPTVARILAEGP